MIDLLQSSVAIYRAHTYYGTSKWLDESGNDHHAVPTGSPVWDGEKFTLDGATQYFTIPDHDDLDPGAADFAIVIVTTPAADISDGARLIEKRAASGAYWEVYYDLPNQRFMFEVSDGTLTETVPAAGTNKAPPGTQVGVILELDRIDFNVSYIHHHVFSTGLTDTNGSTLPMGFGSVSSAQDITVGRRARSDDAYYKGSIWAVMLVPSRLTTAELDTVPPALVASDDEASYTAHDSRQFYAAVKARIAGEIDVNGSPASAEIGHAPDDARTRTPYAVIYPLDEDDDPETLGDLADPHRGTFFAWQVTSVGSTPDETLWMQQKVRAALIGWQPVVYSGITCGFVERDGGDGLRREDGAQPARFRAVDTFTCFASA